MATTFNIAFEISSLLAVTSKNGEKSGIYRLLYNTIITLSAKLAKEKSKNILYLFTIYPHLLDSQPNEFNQLLKKPHVKLIYIAPYCVKHPFSLLSGQIRFFSRHAFGEYSQANYMMRLKQELKRKAVSTIHHSETCFFEAPGTPKRAPYWRPTSAICPYTFYQM